VDNYNNTPHERPTSMVPFLLPKQHATKVGRE
jgi:hypothetical protein